MRLARRILFFAVDERVGWPVIVRVPLTIRSLSLSAFVLWMNVEPALGFSSSRRNPAVPLHPLRSAFISLSPTDPRSSRLCSLPSLISFSLAPSRPLLLFSLLCVPLFPFLFPLLPIAQRSWTASVDADSYAVVTPDNGCVAWLASLPIDFFSWGFLDARDTEWKILENR